MRARLATATAICRYTATECSQHIMTATQHTALLTSILTSKPGKDISHTRLKSTNSSKLQHPSSHLDEGLPAATHPPPGHLFVQLQILYVAAALLLTQLQPPSCGRPHILLHRALASGMLAQRLLRRLPRLAKLFRSLCEV
jgi:hypothetical protein